MFDYDDCEIFCDDVSLDEMMLEFEAMKRDARDKAEKKLARLLLELNESLSEHGIELGETQLQAFQDAIDELLTSVES